MKFWGFFLASVLLAAGTASAQVPLATPFLMPSSAVAAVSSAAPAAADPAQPAAAAEPGAADPAAADPASAPKPPQVIGVFEHFNFQAYVGLALTRFYEAPHAIQTRTGFDSSMTYYYKGNRLAVDGELMATFGSQFSQRSRFLFAGGGPRFRWAGERNLEFWSHALVGGSHYTPQTAYGSQGAFAYEAGLGVDALAHHQRLAYRLELDMLGTRFFSTYQYSPKASIGIVWKF